jgi:hypothetical protein
MEIGQLSVIDAHAHCGIIDRSYPQSFSDYSKQVKGTDISGVALFSPVLEIYDRYNFNFIDTPTWQQRRQESNAYLLSLTSDALVIFPYYFIWNDFAVENLTDMHCGIKWHRHADEPVYHYDDPKCQLALDKIRRRNLPVVLEEELDHTIHFIQEMAVGITVIIPHLGLLNGGYQALSEAGIWERVNVWADTALASRNEILAYLKQYGPDRLMFGSDFPFGSPSSELSKVRSLKLDSEVEIAVLGGNFIRLQNKRTS